jgi:hypothetical protein
MTTQTQGISLNEVVNVSIDDSTLTQITEGNRLATTVKGLTINNNQEYLNSGEFLKQVKTVSKLIDDSRKELTRPLDEAKKRVMEFFKEPLDQLLSAESMLKRAILDYQQEQERIRREEEQKAIARAKAEEERKRRALEERATKAEESGNTAKAELLRERADDVYVPTVVTAPTLEKVKGISTKKVWKFRVTDECKIPREYLVINEAMLGKMAQATQGKIPVPGVEFYQEDVLSAGRA